MPGPLTYAAITLLARDRIGQIKRALLGKKLAGTAHELELHVLQLATQAEDMMKATQPVIEPPVRLYGPPLTDQVSRFLLLGAIGPDLPRYGAYFNPGQRWLFDTLHKGTPDGDRERVLANTTNLVFDFWKRVGPLIDSGISDQTKAKAAKQQMQAYVLGHLCHIAADVLSHPYFESIEARLADSTVTPNVRLMSRDDVAGAFDVRIADKFFSRGTDTRTKKWADWFPTPSEVPDAFGQAMADSVASIYGARAEGLPAFEEAFKKIDPAPPALSADLIRESVDYFRTIIEIERVWTLADWLGATAAMFLPVGFAYFGALVLPIGKDLTRPLTPADGADATARRTYESIVYPVAVSSLGPLVSMIIVSASGRGLRAEGVTGWIQAGLSIVASVGFFASLGGAGAARWTLWFALPLALAVAQIIFVIARGAKENSRKLLFLGPLVQVLLALVFMLLYQVWLHDGVEELQKDSDKRNNLSAFGDFAAWLGIVAVLWFVHALLWRYVFSSSVPDDQNAFGDSGPREFLRLYDDMALIHDAKAPFSSDKLADLSYPPARRPLLKMWWQAGTAPGVQVKISHDRLEFHWPAPAGIDNHVVFAPIAPITIERYGDLLAKAITLDGTRGTLHVSPARDDEKELELAPGAMFSDNGDDQTTVALHNAEAGAFDDVGTSDATAFTIFHAKRPSLTEQMGRDGVAGDTNRPAVTPTKPGLLLQSVGGATPRLYRATAATDGSSPFLRALLEPGDILEIASGDQRIVERVVNDTDVLVVSPFPAFAPAGVTYKRVASNRGARLRGKTTVTTPPVTSGVGPNDVVADVVAVVFGSQFMVGDIVEIGTQTFERRRVVAVKDGVSTGTAPVVTANLLELDAPLTKPAGGASVTGSKLQTVAGSTTQYHATGIPQLGTLFQPGDVIEIATGAAVGEQQTITQVLSPTDIVVAKQFVFAIGAAGVSYKRVSYVDRVGDAETEGFTFAADSNDVFGDGESVMDDAADFAALLCLGAASRLADSVVPDGAKKPLHRVYQVFRNWNLDRRRVNEWKMIVSGGAASERRGDFRVAAEAAPIDPIDASEAISDALVTQRQAAEATVLDRGMLGVFRSWVDMASRPRNDATAPVVFAPGQPTNLELSRAMAYLLDASEGVA